MKIRRQRRRLVLGLALGLTAASVLATPAQAKPDLSDGTSASADATVQQPVRPDDLAVRVSPVAETTGSTNLVGGVDSIADRAHFGGGAQAVPITSDDGIQISWRDAGLWALAATAALLVAMAAMALVLRRRSGRLAIS